MKTSNWTIYIFIMLLTFGLTINAVRVSYSQGDDYLTTYFQNYYSTWLFNPYVTQTLTKKQASLYAISQDDTLARGRTMDGFNGFYPHTDLFVPQSIHYSDMIYGYDGINNDAQDHNLFLTNYPLFTDSIFNQISGNYQSMANPLGMFNQSYNYLSVTSDAQHPMLSIQKCLQERKDLDTTKCILLHRDPSLSVSSGSSSLEYTSSTQLSGIPSVDYLSLYFICFEGS